MYDALLKIIISTVEKYDTLTKYTRFILIFGDDKNEPFELVLKFRMVIDLNILN
jgi:hypothetical protein